MSDETYNGWANRETWLIPLHLDNDPGTHEMARGCVTNYLSETGDNLRELIENMIGFRDDFGMPELPLLAQDIIGGALGRVDWIEVARHYMEEEA